MKIRLISDLHIDVNSSYGVSLTDDGDNDVFTLIAGDISGKVEETTKWIEKNVKYGAFCAGNHIVYNPDVHNIDNPTKIAIEDLKMELHKKFPLESNVTFFDDDVGVISKQISDKVLLIADVLYTDYKLKIPNINPKGLQKTNMHLAEPKMHGSYLNDFVYGFTKQKMYDKDEHSTEPDGLWKLRPQYYLDHHNRVWKKIKDIVENNPDMDIIIMSHHCLSTKCISKNYVNDALNSSYVSNKDSWIKKHPNIKLILSGHVHHRNNFYIGNTLYVLNPLGYCRDTAIYKNPQTNKDEMWTPHCFIDTDTWKLTYEPYDNEKWREVLEAYHNIIMRYHGLFF